MGGDYGSVIAVTGVGEDKERRRADIGMHHRPSAAAFDMKILACEFIPIKIQLHKPY